MSVPAFFSARSARRRYLRARATSSGLPFGSAPLACSRSSSAFARYSAGVIGTTLTKYKIYIRTKIYLALPLWPVHGTNRFQPQYDGRANTWLQVEGLTSPLV